VTVARRRWMSGSRRQAISSSRPQARRRRSGSERRQDSKPRSSERQKVVARVILTLECGAFPPLLFLFGERNQSCGKPPRSKKKGQETLSAAQTRSPLKVCSKFTVSSTIRSQENCSCTSS